MINLQNFSHFIHTLSAPLIFKRLNVFEKKYVANMLKYTKDGKFKTATAEMKIRVNNMYAKHVGFPKSAN